VQQAIAVQANPLICALKLQKSSVCNDGLLAIIKFQPTQWRSPASPPLSCILAGLTATAASALCLHYKVIGKIVSDLLEEKIHHLSISTWQD